MLFPYPHFLLSSHNYSDKKHPKVSTHQNCFIYLNHFSYYAMTLIKNLYLTDIVHQRVYERKQVPNKKSLPVHFLQPHHHCSNWLTIYIAHLMFTIVYCYVALAAAMMLLIILLMQQNASYTSSPFKKVSWFKIRPPICMHDLTNSVYATYLRFHCKHAYVVTVHLFL